MKTNQKTSQNPREQQPPDDKCRDSLNLPDDKCRDILNLNSNIEPKVDIEKLKKEQDVQGLSLQELDQLILEADFTEDIDQLLETLNC